MTNMKLFFSPGACSRVTLIALEKIGMPFETELIVFMRGDHRNTKFLKVNQSGKIPLLITDNIALSQNCAILLWLNKTWPEANLLPKYENSIEEAQSLSQLFKFSSDLHPLVTRIRMPNMICDLENSRERVVSIASQAIAFQLAEFEKSLQKSPWLLGTEWSILDAYLHWVWFRITGSGFPETEFPNIADHYSRTLTIDAFKRAISREKTAQLWLEQNGYGVKFK